MIPFVKYQGAGNDFVLIDLRSSDVLPDLAAFARHICDRRLGVGADGLLLLLPSSQAHYRMRIFNSDGSEPSMCGNGIRCLVDFIQKTESYPSLSIETLHGILTCRKVGEEIAVNLGTPSILHWPIALTDGNLYVVNTGVPHAVLFVEDLDAVDVTTHGRNIRYNSHFAPQGVNVNFVHLDAQKRLSMRTYERGVEGETLACGTGAAAAAFVAFKLHHLVPPITTLTRCSSSQPHIRFLFPQNSQGQTEIEMIGKATPVFEGMIKIS